jgi:hypothetical protein
MISAAMKKTILTIGLALASAMTAGQADAFHGPGNLGFMPFGFYQPYGVRYSNAVRTPPHFAINPPVYYGSRYARPYGESPFASPPLLSAPSSYQVQPAAQFVRPPAMIGREVCNPFAGELGASDLPAADDVVMNAAAQGTAIDAATNAIGPVRFNPFAASDEVAQDSTSTNVSR